MDSRTLPLKVLLVEDSPADAELMLRALRDLGAEIHHVRVASEATLLRALAEFAPDVILSDFSMPGFSGQQALQIAGERAPDTPFLFVSGTIGEELAIDALKRGAIDYILKDNLRRLASAVERALQIAHDRREHHRMEQALRESEERFRSIVENSRDWIWENDGTRTTYSNNAVKQILGYRSTELIGALAVEHMLPEDREQMEQRVPGLIAAGKGWQRWQRRWRHRNGSIRVLESTAVPRMSVDGKVVGYRGVDQDVTERLRQERQIRRLVRIHAVLAAVGNLVLRASDRSELLRNACRVAVEQGGFSAAGIGVRGPDDTLQVAARYGDRAMLAVVAPGAPMPINAQGSYRHHPGIRAFREKHRVTVRDFSDAAVPEDLRDEMATVGVKSEIALPIGAEPWGLLALYSDAVQDYNDEDIELLERLTQEIDYAVAFLAKSERLEYLAYHNPVTDLPNRSSFRERIEPMLQQGDALIVAVLDVQRFAHVNDSRGRAFGDELLRQIGGRLRTLAGPDAVLAHPEADKFLLACRVADPLATAVVRLEALLEQFDRDSFVVEGEELHVDLRAGLAKAPDHGIQGELLERNALAALAEAKRRNLNLHAFSGELHGRAVRRIDLERDLRRALTAGEFELYYQPKFDAASHRLVGAEALLRWHRPNNGMVSPAEFIPVLEDTGLIVATGRWVKQQALATALRWREHSPGFHIAVNVSARELRHVRFLADCRALLEPYLADQPLEIEVTESVLMEDIDQSIHLLHGLRDLGCRVSIDDFGTGYSSLNYLARLPTDEIKIDQSFVAVLAHSPDTMGLVTNVIALAHSLSLRVVAEGVEEEEQAKLLRLLRCDVLQGFLLGRPLPAAEFEARLLNAGPH
ncbi:MAG: EAL domain-containing protein [Lysobacter sp.]